MRDGFCLGRDTCVAIADAAGLECYDSSGSRIAP
jgi:hypothetical protein